MTGKAMSDYLVVFVTVPNPETAAAIAGTLVEEHLAACGNIIPAVRSIYRWQGRIEDESEALLVLKTRSELFEPLRARVAALHSYDVPEIIAVPLVAGHEPYLEWIDSSTEK